MKQEKDIAMEEFQLNIKNQYPNVKYPYHVFYCWLNKPLIIIGGLFLPENFI